MFTWYLIGDNEPRIDRHQTISYLTCTSGRIKKIIAGNLLAKWCVYLNGSNFVSEKIFAKPCLSFPHKSQDRIKKTAVTQADCFMTLNGISGLYS